MAGGVKAIFDMLWDKLDYDAGTHRYDAELLLELKEVRFLLHKVKRDDPNATLKLLFTDLEVLASDVDGLVDARVQSEISRSKFDQKLRRIHERLVPLLNSLRKVVVGVDEGEESSAVIFQVSSRISEHSVSESDILENSISSLKYKLLCNLNMTLVILVMGMSGIVNTALVHGIFTDEEVKSHFPFIFWFSIAKKLDFSRVVAAIEFHCSEIRRARRMPERLLIVLDDVCNLNDDELEKFRLLISNMAGDLLPCVLVSTRSDSVARMMSTVSAQYVTYFPESNSWSDVNLELPPLVGARSCGRGHEKDLRLKAPESAVVTEPQRHSASGLEDGMPGHIKELSKAVPTPCSECESAMDVDTATKPENLTIEKMTYSPPADILPTHKSEMQHTSLETGEGLAAQVPGTTATGSDTPILEMGFEDGPFQSKKKVRRTLY